MSHAIDILDNALRGDPGGISFLEQTSSVYVLMWLQHLVNQRHTGGG